MTAPPADLPAALPAAARPAVERWWAGLSAADRSEAAGLWDDRREAAFFAPQPDPDGRPDDWDRVPAVVGGKFVPHDAAARVADWLDDWHVYLLGHPEVVLIPRVVVVFRTSHLCRGEPAARAVPDAGHLPADFRCPFGAMSCRMRRLQTLAPGRDLFVSPAAAGGWRAAAPWGRRGPPVG